MSVIVRDFTLQDLEIMLSLTREMYDSSLYKSIKYNEQMIRDNVDSFVSRPSVKVLVADHNECGVVGFCVLVKDLFLWSDAVVASDVAFYVSPAYRDISVLNAFMHAIDEWAIADKLHSVTLWHTNPTSAAKCPTVVPYRRYGFMPWGVVIRKEYNA